MPKVVELRKGSAVGLISGGLDSTVVATHMIANYEQQRFLFCEYGQKTVSRERTAFRQICDFLQPTDAQIIDMTWLQAVGKSALFSGGTRLTRENRKSEYVPIRNAALLSAAVALAESVDADAVLIGSTGGDTTCPDNSIESIKAFQKVNNTGTMTSRDISLSAPLIDMSKKQVIEYGVSLGAPFEQSWSCHNNLGSMACGLCSNCESRYVAFKDLGMSDPLTYETAPSTVMHSETNKEG